MRALRKCRKSRRIRILSNLAKSFWLSTLNLLVCSLFLIFSAFSPICFYQDFPLPHKIWWPPPVQGSSSCPGAHLKTLEEETISPTVLNASAAKELYASPVVKKSAMSRPAWAWRTPRSLWVTWMLTSTTPSLLRHIVVYPCSLGRRYHRLIDHHPAVLWLLLCSIQVGATGMTLCIWAIWVVVETTVPARQWQLWKLNCTTRVKWTLQLWVHRVQRYFLSFILRASQDYHDATGQKDLYKLVPFLGCVPSVKDSTPTHPLWTNLPQKGASSGDQLIYFSLS